jgi:hypothetical protein
MQGLHLATGYIEDTRDDDQMGYLDHSVKRGSFPREKAIISNSPRGNDFRAEAQLQHPNIEMETFLKKRKLAVSPNAGLNGQRVRILTELRF